MRMHGQLKPATNLNFTPRVQCPSLCALRTAIKLSQNRLALLALGSRLSFPHLPSAALTQVVVRVCFPPPHAAEHGPHCDTRQ